MSKPQNPAMRPQLPEIPLADVAERNMYHLGKTVLDFSYGKKISTECYYVTEDRGFEELGVLYLEYINVDPRYQRLGFATALLRSAFIEAKRRQLKGADMMVINPHIITPIERAAATIEGSQVAFLPVDGRNHPCNFQDAFAADHSVSAEEARNFLTTDEEDAGVHTYIKLGEL